MVAENKPHLGWQLVCVAGIGAAYAGWGRRGMGERQPAAGITYMALAWGLMIVLMALDGSGTAWILTFGLFPQTWAILPRNKAAVTVIVAVVGIALVRMWQGPRTGDEFIGIAISTVIMLVLSLTLGLFIDRIIREADTRAQTIDELHRTQDELAAAERAQGVAGERERMSREIHDTLAQGFTSVVTLARATELALDRGDLEAVRERVRLIEQTAVDNLSEARLIVAEMTPGHLQSRTLSEALQRLVDAVSAESGMTGTLRVEGEPVVLAANSEVVLLRTAQEGLSNVRRALLRHHLRGVPDVCRRTGPSPSWYRQRGRVRARRRGAWLRARRCDCSRRRGGRPVRRGQRARRRVAAEGRGAPMTGGEPR